MSKTHTLPNALTDPPFYKCIKQEFPSPPTPTMTAFIRPSCFAIQFSCLGAPRPIQTILNQIRNINKRDGIDLQPNYQRGYIWSSDFKDKLLYSIIKSYPIGNVSLRVRTEKNEKGAMQEVVDGQQRLTTIYKFIENDYVIQSDISKDIIEYIIEYMGEDTDENKD